MIVESLSTLKMGMISFLIFSSLGPLALLETARLLPQYSSTFCMYNKTDNLSSKYKPTSSHISAPSKRQIVASNIGFSDHFQSKNYFSTKVVSIVIEGFPASKITMIYFSKLSNLEPLSFLTTARLVLQYNPKFYTCSRTDKLI